MPPAAYKEGPHGEVAQAAVEVALTRRLLKRVAGMSFEEQRALLEMLETRTDVEKRELPRRSSALVVTYTDACLLQPTNQHPA
ncbi:MAG: hypothetical protein U5J82_00555, partial [Desulfobacterales bacterium]|nr:hypothetical protein [Desulfobacterales bacterium]